MAGPNVLFYYYVSGLSFIIFLGIFLLSPWFSKFLSSKYKHLQVKDQINWDTRFVNTVFYDSNHGLFCPFGMHTLDCLCLHFCKLR